MRSHFIALWVGLAIAACTQGTSQRGLAPNGVESASPGGATQSPPVIAASVSTSASSTPRSTEALTPTAPPPTWLTGGGAGSVSGKRGVVTSVTPQATRAGIAILEAGGNAVDAAIAVAYALAVTHPSAGNIGGGGFMLIKMKGQETVALDFREKAPLALTQSYFDAMIKRHARGATAAGVPGTVAGLELARERFGSLPRSQLMAAAIDLATNGYRLGLRQALVLRWAWPLLKQNPTAARIFEKSSRGAPPKAQGERVTTPELALTLRRVSESGRSGFYQGAVGQAIVRGLAKGGGIVSAKDLSSYEAKWRTPLRAEYGGAQIDIMPPPSAGGVAISEMLAMFDALQAKKLKQDSVAAAHLFAEVAKRAHADRRFGVVDPDSVPNYNAAAQRKMWNDPEHWLARFPISMQHVTPASKLHPLYAAAVKELDNTTHFSVADQAGNVVTCTTTLSGSFGAKFMLPGTGILVNNSLAAFGTVGADVPKPGRRMTSSMSPTLVSHRGRAVALLGSPGGDTIPNTVVQVLRNLIDYALPLSEAVDAARVHHGFVPDAIRYERLRPPPKTLTAALRKLGHRIDRPRRTIGDANNIVLLGNVAHAYADPREGGLALAAKK